MVSASTVSLVQCAIGTAFAVASVLAQMSIQQMKGSFRNFQDKLSVPQKEAQDGIRGRRMRLQIEGAVLAGLVIVLWSVIVGGKALPLVNGCAFAAILFVTQYLQQTLSSPPAHLQMSHYLSDDPDLLKEWERMSSEISMNQHVGFIIGIVAAFFLGVGMR